MRKHSKKFMAGVWLILVVIIGSISYDIFRRLVPQARLWDVMPIAYDMLILIIVLVATYLWYASNKDNQ